MPVAISNLDKAIMEGTNRLILQCEEQYSNGVITREQADRRIRTAQRVCVFLLGKEDNLEKLERRT